jgi:hypothetical protein
MGFGDAQVKYEGSDAYYDWVEEQFRQLFERSLARARGVEVDPPDMRYAFSKALWPGLKEFFSEAYREMK